MRGRRSARIWIFALLIAAWAMYATLYSNYLPTNFLEIATAGGILFSAAGVFLSRRLLMSVLVGIFAGTASFWIYLSIGISHFDNLHYIFWRVGAIAFVVAVVSGAAAGVVALRHWSQ